MHGPDAALTWVVGYILEWMLSLDNLFVFHLVFKTYATPKDQVHKAVFAGIIGAVVMRMIFFMVVSTLLSCFGWIRWPLGALLVWSGIEAARGDASDDDRDVKDTRLMKFLTWCLGSRVVDWYDKDGALFVKDASGRLQVTCLFVVVICLEVTDLIFAIDSVTAKIAQIPEHFTAFSSSVLAMYALRTMFFIIEDMVEMFELLSYGLCLILVFIGVELMFAHYLTLPNSSVLIIILSVFLVCVAGSKVKAKCCATRETPETDGSTGGTDLNTPIQIVS